MSTRWKRSTITLVAAALLLTACGNTLSGDPDPAGQVAPNTTNDLHAPDFQIVVYHSGGLVAEPETRLSEVLSLGRPVVLNMWAGLCPPCRLEMPDFQKVSELYDDQVLVFGLDVGPFTNLGTSEEGQALVRELGITYPTGTTPDAAVVQEYRLLGMPTTYFITPDGQILRRWTGLLTADQLSGLVQELLDASTGS